MPLDVHRKFEHSSKVYSVDLPLQYILDEYPGDRLVLLVHGYGDKGSGFLKRAFRNQTPNFSILAPNGPFPVPKLSSS